jgi:GTP-binding protein Era
MITPSGGKGGGAFSAATRRSSVMSKAGFCAIIGAPNAGKSTLVNRLVGSKVSIVTQKVQTTRFPVKGVAIEGEAQIVLVDTPGIFKPKRRLDRAMVRSAHDQASGADAVVHLVDAHAEESSKPGDKKSAEDAAMITESLKSGRKVILALNKIDLVKRDHLLALTQTLFDSGVYSEVFMVSAHNGSGVADMKVRLAELMPEGPWLYPADQTADLPVRLLAAEITREKVYLRVHDELPYSASVETTAFEERKDGSARIEQTIYVERESQRPIILGRNGQTVKWIGEASRKDLGEILDRQVHLFLTVKVRENWQEERAFYADLGLNFDS